MKILNEKLNFRQNLKNEETFKASVPTYSPQKSESANSKYGMLLIIRVPVSGKCDSEKNYFLLCGLSMTYMQHFLDFVRNITFQHEIKPFYPIDKYLETQQTEDD